MVDQGRRRRHLSAADAADGRPQRPGVPRHRGSGARRDDVSLRVSADVHPVVRVRRHRQGAGRRRRLPHAALPRASPVLRRVGGLPRQPAAHRDDHRSGDRRAPAAAAPIAAHAHGDRLGTAAVDAARRLSPTGAADQPSRGRLPRSQPRRFPDRDFQAYEDAVMDEPRFDPLDYVSVINRRKWWFIVPMTLALIVGGLLVWKLPRTYQATTTIAVSAARLAPNVVGAVEMARPDRIRAVSQQLLSRTVLERTARLEHLDANGSIESAIGRIRGSISVTPADSITPGGASASGGPDKSLSPEQKAQLDTYQVSMIDSSPEDAQRIVNRLAQVFVEENSRSREVRAQDTSQF